VKSKKVTIESSLDFRDGDDWSFMTFRKMRIKIWRMPAFI